MKEEKKKKNFMFFSFYRNIYTSDHNDISNREFNIEND